MESRLLDGEVLKTGKLECLKGVTIERVKAMSYEELIELANKMGQEKHCNQLRSNLLSSLDILDTEVNIIQ